MKRVYLIIILSMLLIGGVIATKFGGTLQPHSRPDITKDLTKQEKQIIKQKYNADAYKLDLCWWEDNCYFCDIRVGKLILKRKAITCNFEKDKQMNVRECRENGVCINTKITLTMAELVDKKITKMLKYHIKGKNIKPDDKRLTGKVKKFDKQISK